MVNTYKISVTIEIEVEAPDMDEALDLKNHPHTIKYAEGSINMLGVNMPIPICVDEFELNLKYMD